MAICIFRILTCVGQGLEMAMGNRHVIVSQGTHDYRNGNGVKKKNDVNIVRGNLLHIRVYPYRGTHRDDLSHWLVYNDDSQGLSWSPTNLLIDDTLTAPRDYQTVFFAISPALLDVLHTNLPTSYLHSTEPLIYDDANRIERYRHLGKQQQQQQHHRTDFKHTKNGNAPPILVCETGEKSIPPETRQFNYDDDIEQRLATGNNMKNDLTIKCTETAHPFNVRDFPPKPLMYDTNKHAEKRNQVSIERRSVHFQGESTVYQAETMPVSPPAGGASIASQFMLRSTRGNRQYDVPQVECPISEDGMERFACPTADRMGRYRCIDDHVLCDGFIDCPAGEDEDRQACMFYKTTKAHLDVLADAILRWARGR